MEKQKLPDTELKVMQAIWHIEPPASTSAVREELQKERPWNLSALQTLLGRPAAPPQTAPADGGTAAVRSPGPGRRKL